MWFSLPFLVNGFTSFIHFVHVSRYGLLDFVHDIHSTMLRDYSAQLFGFIALTLLTFVAFAIALFEQR